MSTDTVHAPNGATYTVVPDGPSVWIKHPDHEPRRVVAGYDGLRAHPQPGDHPMITEEQYEQVIKIAAERGADDGKGAAGWWKQDAIGGRVVHQRDAIANARRTLRGLDDGDPAIFDWLPRADLGPQLVEECWEEMDIEDAPDLYHDKICDAYEEAFNLAAQDAIESACRDLLED